jgi:2-octaprenyl-6-methoxyphenol hydroxylase
VIVGGGPVGSALALGLAAAERSVLLLDATTEVDPDDPRTLALSYGSRLILERLAVWAAMTPTTDIRTVHISQRGGFGSAVLTAVEAQTPALGYVVPFASVQRALKERLQRVPRYTSSTTRAQMASKSRRIVCWSRSSTLGVLARSAPLS